MNERATLRTALERAIPFGILADKKPRHFRSMLGTIGETAGKWHKAWRVLNGPCNGCAVQTDGLRDNVMPNSPHFCLTRLGLIEEAIRDDADLGAFANIESLRSLGNDRIERLGRLTQPLLWIHGAKGYRPISFKHAYDLAAQWISTHRGDECGFFCTSKAIANEEYYAFQHFARVVGFTNNVDSCARQCHAASVSALKAGLGVGASTGSLSDFRDTDVLVLAGTNLANNQPLIMRYIEQGRRTRQGRPYVIVVNPYREPGLDRYWVPSSPTSALFGTRICDDFIAVRPGGDIAFFNAVLKLIIEDGLLTEDHRAFISKHTTGFDAMAEGLGKMPMAQLLDIGGVTLEAVRRVAMVLARCENALFCWGMGLTQHSRGTDNVRSVVNLALALAQDGKPKAGLAAIRGQSAVQATGECGVAPDVFPGGAIINKESARRFAKQWGAHVPSNPGLATGRMLEAAADGRIKILTALGGNLRDTMPDRDLVERTLRKLPYRIRFDVYMNLEAVIEPGKASLVIPVRNWYEWDSVFTTTATDRTIRSFGTALPGVHRNLPESWGALRAIARRVLGDFGGFSYQSVQQIRQAMDETIGAYKGITSLSEPHRQMQWGGPYLFADGFTAMPDKRAAFQLLSVDSSTKLSESDFLMLTTRRGFGQWNSQHRPNVAADAFTAAHSRRAVLINPSDAQRLALREGQHVRVETTHGPFARGICKFDSGIRPGHLQAFWPLANDLIQAGVYDGPSGEPDYNVPVRIVGL